MLVRRVGEHELGDHPQATAVCLAQEMPEVAQVAVGRVDLPVVRDVVSVVAQRRRVEGQQPQGGDAEVLEVVELLDEPLEVPDAVAVAVVEGTYVGLVEDAVLVPQGLRLRARDDLHATLPQYIDRRHGAEGELGIDDWLTEKMWQGTSSWSSLTKLVDPCQT